ncbi:MAG: hypothetical protein IJD41_00430 [Alphaproteobacteria bacterium]|nr:hypothetical protein [Alphaproteobacteria bacterium]MBQ7127544.1 hypothetical protein [Alphaproteobacteria bacterium]
MRKILIATILVTLSNTANAKFLAGENNRCFINTSGWNESWFCGKGDDKCSGKKATGGKRYVNYKVHGEKFTEEDNDDVERTYYCCNGTSDTIGKFIEASAFETTETITIDVANGKCTYERTVDICGNIVEDKPCTEATDCARGIVKRNGVCIPPCDDGFVFESENSNRCVPCEETERQAIVGIGYDKVCKKCKSYEILDKDDMECKVKEVPKSTPKESITTNTKGETVVVNSDNTTSIVLTSTSKDAMRKCWQCPGRVAFKQCILYLTNQTNTISAEEIKSGCKITD